MPSKLFEKCVDKISRVMELFRLEKTLKIIVNLDKPLSTSSTCLLSASSLTPKGKLNDRHKNKSSYLGMLIHLCNWKSWQFEYVKIPASMWVRCMFDLSQFFSKDSGSYWALPGKGVVLVTKQLKTGEKRGLGVISCFSYWWEISITIYQRACVETDVIQHLFKHYSVV